MDSDTETRDEENESFCDVKLKVTELESKLFEEKQRFKLLQTEHDKYKSECMNLKEIKSGLEMEIESFREREAKDRNMIKKLSGMIESYDKKLAEFMQKHGDENSSLRKRNDTIVVKKEIEDNLDDEMLKGRKDLVPVDGDVDEDNLEIGKWSKKRVIKEMWRRENSSAYAFMPSRIGKSTQEKRNQNLGKKKKTKLPDRSLSLTVHIIKANEEQFEDSQNKLAITERIEDQDVNLPDIRINFSKMNKQIRHEVNNPKNNDFFSF